MSRSKRPAAVPRTRLRTYTIYRCETLPKKRRGKTYRKVVLKRGTIPQDTPEAMLAHIQKIGRAREADWRTNPCLHLSEGTAVVKVNARGGASLDLRLRGDDVIEWMRYTMAIKGTGLVVIAEPSQGWMR